jgi:hypothetical protein
MRSHFCSFKSSRTRLRILFSCSSTSKTFGPRLLLLNKSKPRARPLVILHLLNLNLLPMHGHLLARHAYKCIPMRQPTSFHH